jgi:hypothetical protein
MWKQGPFLAIPVDLIGYQTCSHNRLDWCGLLCLDVFRPNTCLHDQS